MTAPATATMTATATPTPTPTPTPTATATPTPPATPPPPAIPPPPPPIVYVPVERPPHAPRYSFWTGGRVGLLGYGGGLYINDPYKGTTETTGNFVRPGLALELDAGARIYKRYIPYVGLELGLVGAGHRFEGGPTTHANTAFFGLGFRYLAGDVDTVAFAADVSFGLRRFQVSNDSGTWSATGVEYVRLGLGAEVRVNDRFTASPMLTISGGSLTDTSGSISFAPGQGDGQTGPLYTGDSGIPGFARTSYLAIVLGCGGHLDLFGQ
jgi:hypothetical protein